MGVPYLQLINLFLVEPLRRQVFITTKYLLHNLCSSIFDQQKFHLDRIAHACPRRAPFHQQTRCVFSTNCFVTFSFKITRKESAPFPSLHRSFCSRNKRSLGDFVTLDQDSISLFRPNQSFLPPL